MKRTLVLLLGIALIAGGLIGASLTWPVAAGVGAQDGPAASQTHARMHAMMDQMMGAGAAERMHAAMPGSEAMMEDCASGMASTMSGGMPGMPMDGIRDGAE